MARYFEGGASPATYTIQENSPIERAYHLDDVREHLAKKLQSITTGLQRREGQFSFDDFYAPNDGIKNEGTPTTITMSDFEHLEHYFQIENIDQIGDEVQIFPSTFTEYEYDRVVTHDFITDTKPADCYRFTVSRPDNPHGDVVLDVFRIDIDPYRGDYECYSVIRDDTTVLKIGWPGANEIEVGERRVASMFFMSAATAMIGIR